LTFVTSTPHEMDVTLFVTQGSHYAPQFNSSMPN